MSSPSKQAPIASPEILKDFYCDVCNCLLSVPPIRLMVGRTRYVCGRCPGEGFRECLLESFASHFQFPCRYTERGCKLNLIWPEVDKHEQVCDHKFMKCFVLNCVWEGKKMEIIRHFESIHEGQILNEKDVIKLSNKGPAKYYYFLNSDGAFEIELEDSEELALVTYTVTNLWSKEDISSYGYRITFMNAQFNFSLRHEAKMFGVASYLDKKTIKSMTDSLDEIQVNIKIDKSVLLNNIKRFCVECPKCFSPMEKDTYIGRCGHSICKTCAHGGKRMFSCPMCPKFSVNEKFVKNHAMNEFLESFAFKSK